MPCINGTLIDSQTPELPVPARRRLVEEPGHAAMADTEKLSFQELLSKLAAAHDREVASAKEAWPQYLNPPEIKHRKTSHITLAKQH